MTEIRFYHLQKTAIDDALSVLLQKVMDMDYKSDVIINGDVKEFSDILWENNNKNSFIANDIGDNINENSPVAIYNNLNVKVENLRKNRFFINEINEDLISGADLNCFVFNGNDEKILHQARLFWKKMTQKAEYDLCYYYQDPVLGWKKK